MYNHHNPVNPNAKGSTPQSTIPLQSCCNPKIPHQSVNIGPENIEPETGGAGEPTHQRRGQLPNTPIPNNPSQPSTSQPRHLSRDPRHNGGTDQSLLHFTSSTETCTRLCPTKYLQLPCNPQSNCNPVAITKYQCNGRTVGPETIEPGRRPGPNRSPIAPGFGDCAAIRQTAIRTPKGFDRSAIPGNISHSVSRQKEERAAFPAPSTTLPSIYQARQYQNEHIPTLPRPRQINDAIIAILAQSKIMAQS